MFFLVANVIFITLEKDLRKTLAEVVKAFCGELVFRLAVKAPS